jgi:Glycosyl transferase family 2
MMRFRLSGAWVAALVALAVATILSKSNDPAILPYVIAIATGSMVVSLLLWRVEKANTFQVLGGTALLHLVALFGVPAFEDDYYRFIWDGWQIAKFGTPYGIPPEAFFADAQVPPALRAILDGVNNPDVPTIYGPTLELLFAGVYALSGTELLGWRLLFTLANLTLIVLMLRRYPAARVALYAWNPLVVSEVALHVHPDALMALALFAGAMLLSTRPLLAGALFALAAGTKLVALAAWPLLLRARPVAILTAAATLLVLYTIFAIHGNGAGFESTATFATQWHFNPLGYQSILWIMPSDPARLIAVAIAGIGVIVLHARAEGRIDMTLAVVFGLILFCAPAVNAWYLLWLLPFAVAGRQVWPFAAAVVLPLSYLTGLNLGDENLGSFEVHWAARLIEVGILFSAIMWDIWQAQRIVRPIFSVSAITTAYTAIIIPALNEEKSVGGVVAGLANARIAGLKQIIVVDNGSTDETADMARAAGAVVVHQPERGYGAACLAGIAALPDTINIVLFADADASDIPADAARLVAAVAAGEAAMVIGSRMLGNIEPGAMSWPQRFGNLLAPALIRIIWGVRFTDLGPLRAIRRDALNKLQMEDRDFGWTIEMQVRAAKCDMPCLEIPVGYRKRIGISKISGTVSGVIGAGTKILFIIAREAFGNFGKSNWSELSSEPGKNRSLDTCVV